MIDLTTKPTLLSGVPWIQTQPSVTLKSRSGTSNQHATPINAHGVTTTNVHGVTQIPNIDASSYEGLTQGNKSCAYIKKLNKT